MQTNFLEKDKKNNQTVDMGYGPIVENPTFFFLWKNKFVSCEFLGFYF